MSIMTSLADLFRTRAATPPRDPVAEFDWTSARWVFVTTWISEPYEIAPGFDIRELKWHSVIDPGTGNPRLIDGIDGIYGHSHKVFVWWISVRDEVRIFAATEVSNGVWIVFVPEDAAQDAYKGDVR